jgi:hypothetical protein
VNRSVISKVNALNEQETVADRSFPAPILSKGRQNGVFGTQVCYVALNSR